MSEDVLTNKLVNKCIERMNLPPKRGTVTIDGEKYYWFEIKNPDFLKWVRGK